jgi:hypothetical protein
VRTGPSCPHADSILILITLLLVRLCTDFLTFSSLVLFGLAALIFRVLGAAVNGLRFLGYTYAHISQRNGLYVQHMKTSNTYTHIINHINHATNEGRSYSLTLPPSVRHKSTSLGREYLSREIYIDGSTSSHMSHQMGPSLATMCILFVSSTPVSLSIYPECPTSPTPSHDTRPRFSYCPP